MNCTPNRQAVLSKVSSYLHAFMNFPPLIVERSKKKEAVDFLGLGVRVHGEMCGCKPPLLPPNSNLSTPLRRIFDHELPFVMPNASLSLQRRHPEKFQNFNLYEVSHGYCHGRANRLRHHLTSLTQRAHGSNCRGWTVGYKIDSEAVQISLSRSSPVKRVTRVGE